MGRIRTIKPELLEDARTAGLTDAAFRLFIAAILLADDQGNLRADERWLEGQVWWVAAGRGDSPKSAASLRELSESGLLLVYRVRDQFYASIRNWKKHQRIDNAGKPRVPQPSDPEAEVSRNFAANLRETPLDLRPPTSDHDPEKDLRDLPVAPSQLAILKSKVDQAAGEVGAKRARKKRTFTDDQRASAMRVLGKLGEANGVRYTGSDAHLGLIADRIADGIHELELRAIVAYCASPKPHGLGWEDDERMRAYLTPETLFGPKSHTKYLDPARSRYAKELEQAMRPDAVEVA